MPKKKQQPLKKVTKKTVKKVKKKVEEKVKEGVEKAKEEVKEVAEELGKEIGKVTHFFDKIGVAVIEIAKGLKIGEKIRIKGATTNFEQKVDSMQVEHEKVEKAKKGDAIGLKVKGRVRPNDKVYVKK